MIPRKTMDENQIIHKLASFPQSTHGSVPTRSAAKAALKLSSRYFTGKTEKEIDEACDLCIKQLEKKAEESKDEELRQAIQYNLKMAKQTTFSSDEIPLVTIDLYTLPEESKEAKVSHVFLPKQILTLVWKGIQDALAEDLLHREETFFNGFKRNYIYKLCQQGVRHEWIFSLNKIHPDVDIIEDLEGHVLYFLKEKVNALFWKNYTAKEVTAETKKKLTAALLNWLSENDPSDMCKLVDPDNTLLKSFKELLVEHGCDPNLADIPFQNALYSLEFSCDGRDFLNRTHQILNALDILYQEERNTALHHAKKYIQTTFDLENVIFQKNITHFQSILETFDQLIKYKNLFITLDNTIHYNKAFAICVDYFKTFKEKEEIELSLEARISLQEFNKVLEQCKSDSLHMVISSFYACWFGADGNKKTLQPLYTILIDEVTQNKIKLTDKDIEKLLEKNIQLEESKEESRTAALFFDPYEINRIFLHSQIVDPSDWTKNFVSLFTRVLDFVKNRFDIPSEKFKGLSEKLFNDSYPRGQLLILNYRLNDYFIKVCGQSIDNPRPHKYIPMPHDVKTIDEWIMISSLLTPEQRYSIYAAYRLQINSIIKSAIDLALYKQENIHLDVIMETIPQEKRKDFICYLGIDRLFSIFQDEKRFNEKFTKILDPAISKEQIDQLSLSGYLVKKIVIVWGKDWLLDFFKSKKSFFTLLHQLNAYPSEQHMLCWTVFDRDFLRSMISDISDLEKARSINDFIVDRIVNIIGVDWLIKIIDQNILAAQQHLPEKSFASLIAEASPKLRAVFLIHNYNLSLLNDKKNLITSEVLDTPCESHSSVGEGNGTLLFFLLGFVEGSHFLLSNPKMQDLITEEALTREFNFYGEKSPLILQALVGNPFFRKMFLNNQRLQNMLSSQLLNRRIPKSFAIEGTLLDFLVTSNIKELFDENKRLKTTKLSTVTSATLFSGVSVISAEEKTEDKKNRKCLRIC